MQKIVSRLLYILILFISTNVLAQENYTISGKVINEKKLPIKGATVFISGSKKITASDSDGTFTFTGMGAGNYSISTRMLGYDAPSQSVSVSDKSLQVTIAMNVKPIMLNMVNIGTDNNWKKYFELFKDQFLGTSENAKKCVILNPEIINFSSRNLSTYHMLLEAYADDFLIIENKLLGYRIKYLLRTFNYNSTRKITFYDGDCYFEELNGTDKEKVVWAENRAIAYEGSLMHYLRSVFAKTTIQEGFTTNELVTGRDQKSVTYTLNPNPVNFDMLVNSHDNAFISFKFKALNIAYDPKQNISIKKSEIIKPKKSKKGNGSNGNQSNDNSQLLLNLDEAIIDDRGSILSGYRTFLIRGNWADKRIGDQLPFEYLRPEINVQTLTKIK